MNHINHPMDDDMETMNMMISKLIVEKARQSWHDKGREVIARNALMEGAPYEFINRITGLDVDIIRSLR